MLPSETSSYYDFKERFDAQYKIVSGRECCDCKVIYNKYFFWSKAVALVLFINALFSIAIFGLTSKILTIILGSDSILTQLAIGCGVTQMLFPIAGHIADIYIRRHNVIRFGLGCAWIGYSCDGFFSQWL